MPIRLHPFVSTAALYATNLPLVLGWILALVGLLGPELSKNTSMAIASIGPLSGAAQPDGESGAWFGPFGSCYKINGGQLVCSGGALNPNYNTTLDPLVEAGLPQIMAGVLPDHLQTTPGVQVASLVLVILAIIVSVLSVTSARLRLWMPLNISQWVYAFGIFLAFWAFLFNLTAALAQQVQFSQAMTLFNQIATVSRRVNTTPGFQQASFCGALPMQWAASAFIGLCLPLTIIQFYLWPDEADYGWSTSGKA